jgi:hypothetical protein
MMTETIEPKAEGRAIIAASARAVGLPYRVVLGRLRAAVADGRLDRLVGPQRMLYHRAMQGDAEAAIEAGRALLGQVDER